MIKKVDTQTKIILLLFGIFILLLPMSIKAWQEYSIVMQGWDLVDSGKHLDWGGSTSYSTYFNYGVSQWNGHISGVIRKDTLLTVKDITISDKNKGANGYPAETISNGKLIYNTYYMDSYSANKKKNISIHELGHALGLEHRDNEPSSVMREHVTTITTISNGDKANYTYAYNNVY